MKAQNNKQIKNIICKAIIYIWLYALWFFVILSYPLCLHAAFEFQPVGAKAAGVGDAGTALTTGAEGLFWNPAAVAWGSRMSLFCGYDRPFGMTTLSTQALGMALHLNHHGLGFTYQGYGFSLYKERRFGCTYGLRISQAGLGIAVRTLQMALRNEPNRQWVVFDIGLRVNIHPHIHIGAVAWNMGGKQVAILGQGGAVGIAATTIPHITVLIDIQKEAGLPTGASGGITYMPASQLTLRVGIGSRPERLTAGTGIHLKHITLDYAVIYHAVLGLSHRVGFEWAW